MALVPAVWAQTSSPTDPVALFVQYGIAGLVIVALLMGLLWAKPAVDRLIKDKDKIEAQRDALLEVVTSEVLPSLAASTSANAALKPILEDVVRVLEQVHGDMRPPPAPRRRAGG